MSVESEFHKRGPAILKDLLAKLVFLTNGILSTSDSELDLVFLVCCLAETNLVKYDGALPWRHL